MLVSFIAVGVQAQETEENTRSEYIICKLKEGKTMADVMAFSKKYGEIAKKNGSKYNQYLIQPFMNGSRWAEAGYTHGMIGVWPNGLEMYREYGKFYNGDKVDQSDSPHTCDITLSTTDVIIANTMKDNEPMDEIAPMQLADCKLNEGVSMDYVVEVHREMAAELDKMNLDGFLMVASMPYLGWSSADGEVPDFVLSMNFQSFEHRAQMAMNYYKAGEKWQQKINGMVSCSDPRAYAAQTIFRNW